MSPSLIRPIPINNVTSGYGLMANYLPSKQKMRVRFPLSALDKVKVSKPIRIPGKKDPKEGIIPTGHSKRE